MSVQNENKNKRLTMFSLLPLYCLSNDVLMKGGEGGGGRILPARTLDAYNFLNKQAKATELGDFS